ncbi:MAG: hypothetical protein ACHQ1D_10985, partial [Nitrososphaerales archaeon]
MSTVSFLHTDITGVRLVDNTTFGGEDKVQIIEEKWFEQDFEKHVEDRRVSLDGVLSVYRNLRDNYEFRRRYDEAGKFFIREMELKRRYRKITHPGLPLGYEIKKNNWFRRNVFSLTGWYYHLSRYREDLHRPTLVGILIVFLSTLLWLSQSNPNQDPSFLPSLTNTNIDNNNSKIFTNTTASPNDT